MSAFTPVDSYCERLSPEFWAEPVNALSNLAFWTAAWAAWSLARRSAASKGIKVSASSWCLIGLVAVIGLGSFLFHTLAVTWAMWADVLPILIYQVVFLGVYMRWVVGGSPRMVGLSLTLFLLAAIGASALPADWLNGSLSYAPALLFVLGLGVFHWRAGKREAGVLLVAGGVFMVSLALRSVDMLACEVTGIGTHFLWHMLNGVVLYLSTRAVVLNSR